jgi:hypothetical protein
MVPTTLLLALGVVARAFPLGDHLSAALRLASLAVLLWAVPLCLLSAAAVFRTGQRAFGRRAGLGYAALAVVLTFVFGLGVFVVPLMVRSDVQRLLGVPPGDSDSTR